MLLPSRPQPLAHSPTLALPFSAVIAILPFLLLRGKRIKNQCVLLSDQLPYKALQMTHQGYTVTVLAFFPPLIPYHHPSVLLLFVVALKPIFSLRCMDFRKTFDKDGPGSWMINIIFLTCPALSATCNSSLPRVGSSSLTFPLLPRSFPCFLSPWVCAAFSANS